MQRPQHRLELDPSVIAKAIDAAVVASTEVVNFHFSHLQNADLSSPAHVPDNVFMRVKSPVLTAEQRRAMHENWVLARAFQELLRAVRQGLELAHVITAVVNRPHNVKSSITVAEFLKPFEVRANELPFPNLLAEVNSRLESRLVFADSYQSLQAARNCLEHRAGIIGERDTKGNDEIVISIPRVKLFYTRAGQEIELERGHLVAPDEGKDHAEIAMRIEERKRPIKIGERVTFTLTEFNEIAFACYYLGRDLIGRLPKPVIFES
jgi:hypothetical protein